MATLRDILQGALQPDPEQLDFSASHIDQRSNDLRQRFAAIDAELTAHEIWASAMAGLPPARRQGWLAGVQAALDVTLSHTRRGSQLLRSAALGLLPISSGAWDLAPAFSGAVRGGATSQLQAANPTGVLQVVADDAGSLRRILVTISEFPQNVPPPVLLVLAQNAAPQEFDPEVENLTSSVTLRYQVTLPPGGYQIFLGNPRAAGGGPDGV